MFIGHVPAGYLWTRLLINVSKTVEDVAPPPKVLLLGMFASIIPDLDMFYFYLIDHRQHLHHSYWTHMPLIWIAILGIWLLAAYAFKKPRLMGVGIIVGSNILVHMVLDTLAGKIRWLYPFSNTDFVMAHVPAVHGWWVWNFVLHWTFLVEIALVVGAVYVWLSNRKRTPNLA
jgi:hypothetical protein